jgi:Bacteriophage baseplate protein W
MIGMNASNGAPLDGFDHLRQSITGILTTPVGSRVMRRDYGSDLYRLVDQPLNSSTVLEIYTATAVAISRWEPRVEVEEVHAVDLQPGRIELDVDLKLVENGASFALRGVVVQ